MSRLKVGLVGTGYFASKHAKAIKSLSNAELIGVVGKSKEKAMSFAARFKIKRYDDYESMLQDGEIDVVDLVIPPKPQETYTKLAAKAKKHVLVSKPIATTVKAAAEMIKICNQNNVLLSVIFPRRSVKPMHKVRNIVQSGKLGKIFLVNIGLRWHRSETYFTKSKWKKEAKQSGGGVLITQGIHLVDLMQWIIGKVDSVTAKCARNAARPEIEESCVATLKFKSGAIGSLSASSALKKDIPDLFEIHGTKGSIIMQGNRIKHYYKKTKSRIMGRIYQVKNWLVSWLPCEIFEGLHHGYFSFPKNIQILLKIHLKQVFDKLQEGKSLINGVDGTESLRIIEAIYKSAKLMKEVKVR